MQSGHDFHAMEVFRMAEVFVSIKIEPLDEGGYLASNELQGLIAQGRTAAETLEIAQDVARRLIESCLEHKDPLPPKIRRALVPRRKRSSTIQIPVTVEPED
jgi:antitoxin HicB